MLHVDLSQLAGGTLQEKFDREITRVIENMQDPNTPFGEKRKITSHNQKRPCKCRRYYRPESGQIAAFPDFP